MSKRTETERLLIAANQNKKAGEYWKAKLSGGIDRNGFPPDNVEMNGAKAGKENLPFNIPEEQCRRLAALSKNNHHTLHVILTAVLKVMVSKYNSRKKIIIGTPIYKQQQDTEFINTVLPLVDEVIRETNFKEFLLQVRQTLMEAVENQNYPMEILLNQLDISDTGKNYPLFGTAILLGNIHKKEYLDHLLLDMTFIFNWTENGLEGIVQYDTARYEPNTVKGIISHFRGILDQVQADIQQPITQLELVNGEEKHRLLYKFNETETPYPAYKLLHQLFEEQVNRTPEKVALVRDSVSLTYRELNEKANRLAWKLKMKGVNPDGIVGLLANISIETIIGMIGILKSGAGFLPIDSDYPENRIRYMLKDSSAEILLAAAPFSNEDAGVAFDGEVFDLRNPALYTGDDKNPEHLTAPGHLAYAIYTSGSTGRPKGVMIEHRNIVNQIHGLKELFFTGAPLNHLLLAPFTFDPSVQHVFSPITYGGILHLVSRETKLDAEELVGFIRENRIDVVDAVPSQIRALLEFAPRDERLKIKLIILAGEVFTYDLYRKLDENFDVEKIINIYGPTEATINSTYYECRPDYPRRMVPIGKPLMNYKIRILNEDRELLPVGVTGQMYIAGDGIARGYFNSPDLTSQKFVENPYIPGERMYETGDMARWLPDGNLEFIGRRDHQVKIRGMRVEIGEIENRLIKQEGIEEAVVIDRRDGEGNKYLCAYYISEQPQDDVGLKQALAEQLPDYMVPTYFVRLDSIPLTANDKLDRKALPDPDIDGKHRYVAPGNEIEKRLVDVWCQLLGKEKEQIGVETDFFEIGGHSLKATVLAARIHKAFDTKVPLRYIFERSTVRELANYIAAAKEDKYEAIQPAPKKDHYKLSAAQKRFYMLQQMEKDNVAYNITDIVPLNREIRHEKLQQVIHALIQRHESFRTGFEMIEGEPLQVIYDNVEFEIENYDVEKTAGALGGKGIESIIQRFVRPFDLTRPPLLRVGLIKIEKEKHILMADMHHIISDGISGGILVSDFQALYNGNELPPLRLQYKDYSEWQNRDVQQEIMEKQGEFWLELFKDNVKPLELPTDYPRAAVRSLEGESIPYELSPEQNTALAKLAAEESVTFFMILYSVYAVLLSKICASNDVIVGTGVSGRKHADMMNIIGLFFNTIPLRCAPAAEKRYIDFLAEIKKSTLEAFENQDYPFDRLVQQLLDREIITGDPSHNPLYDTLFSLNVDDTSGEENRQTQEPGKQTDTFEYTNNAVKLDLIFNAVEKAGKIIFSVDYSTALFKRSTVEEIIKHYAEILDQVSAQKEIKLEDVVISRETAVIKSRLDDTESTDFNF